jgi:hypothetical protein
VSGAAGPSRHEMRNCEIGHQRKHAHDQGQFEQASDQTIMSEISEDEIDGNLMGTFPASDPPSWTLGVERHKQLASERRKK